MHIKILGTAAAEGIPALFCNCPVCSHARKTGGKEIRTRAQTLIDNRLLIDFPADSYMHMLNNHIDLSAISHLLVTHSHDDHFYPMDLLMRLPGYGKNWGQKQLHVYGNAAVIGLLKEMAKRFSEPEIWNYLVPHEVKPFDTFMLDEYKITALPASHMKTEDALLYLLEKDSVCYLHAYDTGVLSEKFYQGLRGKQVNCVCVDCTMGKCFSQYWGHMGFENVLDLKERLDREKITNSNTKWVITHFSHNGNWLYEDMEKELRQSPISVAYDGMKIDL